MSSSVSNLQLLNNTEHRVKFRTGSDINNVDPPIVGEMLVETSRQSDISFDGQSKIDTDYIFGGGEISLSAWFKTTNSKSFIIATDSPSGSSDTSFAIGFKDNITAYVLIGNPGQQIYNSGSVSAINDGNWHNVIVTIDSSYVMNFYIDGVLETTHTFSILPGPSDYVTHYGSGWSDGSDPFYSTWGLDGKLNGLGIWERVLTNEEINTISSSGRYSPSPSHFSPDLWVGSTDPALYTCTDTSGTISKITDLTAKIGDVPMLRTNSNEFIPNAPSPFNGGFSYSFWFYDDVTQETGTELLFYNDVSGELGGGSQNSYVVINYSLPRIEFRQHVSRGNVTFHNDLIANYGGGNEINFKYEKNKLNNILITKEATSPFLTKFYFNSELVAECSPNAAYYPGNFGLQKISSTVLLIGDLAYWDTDISSISDEVYSPNQGHKGFQGDWRNLSIAPKHYWKLGAPMDLGQVKDLGTDGTNHFTTTQPLEETYSTEVGGNSQFYMFTPEDGVMHGLSNGGSERYDPEMYMFVGDTINITRPDSSHPLHIKDSSGNDVAVQNSTISNTYALSFNGSNHVDCGVLTALHGSPEMSLSFWFKSNTSGEGPSIGSRTGSSNQWGFLRAGGVNYVQVVTNNNGQYFSYTSPADTNYHHYAITYNRGSIEFYIDGSPVSFSLTSQGGGATATLHSENTSFNIGKNDSFYSDGLFDEVSIFNSALTASDITYIYNRGAPNDISSLNPIDWWRCGDDNLGSGTIITDQGVDSNGNPSGNDGSLVGNPTFSTDTPAAFITTFSPTIAGTYQYYCTSHVSMIGNINVQQRAGYKNIFGIVRS